MPDHQYTCSLSRSSWHVPTYNLPLWIGRQRRYCVVIPVLNEGVRVGNLLTRMYVSDIWKFVDIIIVDGQSSDGSLHVDHLKKAGVSGFLVKTGPGKLSAQLRCAYAFALDQGYEGVVTIDGNDKDDPEAIPRFVEALKGGVDFVQGSRFVAGGHAENTPWLRYLAIRGLHAPFISLLSGFHWTDTTQGFRAYSRKLLLDDRIAPFRDDFVSYELLAYLSVRAPQLGFRCLELPTIRRYPKGAVPTKIGGWRGNLSILRVLWRACRGGYNTK